MQAQAQTFQGSQNHAAFRKSYRHHNPLILSAQDQADLAVLAAWQGIEKEMAQASPVEPMHSNPLALLGDEVDTLSLIETQIDLFQGKQDISPSCRENLLDAWVAGQASYSEVVKAHQPKQTYTQRLVKRAYLVLSFVGGYARVR